ncbi:MAG TPA: FAD-dependent oxidoreductase [Acidobacteriaceae bacterium]|nr:FAD-dependent oxidoreductase [Acidobacteriaceae bacterium]
MSSQNSTAADHYDLVVIGSGEGGKFLAWTFARQGKKVAVIERKYIGGSCPNIACLPSKNVIHSAKVASYFYRSEEFGIHKENVHIDMLAVRDRKRKMVEGLVQIHINNYKASGAELIMGSARFLNPTTIEVALNEGGTRHITATDIVLGTGTRATLPDISGLLDTKPLTHIEALELDHIPEHLIVLGGGYIGLELAQAMRRFGSRVTVVEHGPRLLSREDEDISEAMQQLFHDEGIDLVHGADATRIEGLSGESITVHATQNGNPINLHGTDLLVATGRTPNTQNMGLDLAGVALTDRGYIAVNERLQTTAPHIWAVGDCAGSPHFTHISFDDFRVVRDNLNGHTHVTTGRHVPYCMFTDPELAHIGLNEREAREQGIAYKLFKVPMAADLRTRTLSETRGFMKALVDPATERILGFTCFGVSAGEIMSAVQIAMLGNLPYTALREAILTHPTLAEGLIVLFSSAAHG